MVPKPPSRVDEHGAQSLAKNVARWRRSGRSLMRNGATAGLVRWGIVLLGARSRSDIVMA